MKRLWPILCVSYTILAPTTYAIEFKFSGQGSLLGGQYFSGSNHSEGLNADLSLNPLISLGSRLHLVPIYSTSYHQTQSVYSFLGENTLIQKQWDQLGSLRATWILSSEWRLRPRAGYKMQQTKQSVDENLSNGLFNFNRFFGGASVQRFFPNSQVDVGYEWSRTRYPNYQSLASDSRLTAIGITANAGRDVLNFNSHLLTIDQSWQTADQRLQLNHRFSWLRNQFRDQKVTEESGGFQVFSDQQRHDDVLLLNLNQGIWIDSAWSLSLGEALQLYRSNQNAYDTVQLRFNPRYYNFYDAQLTPTVLWLHANRKLSVNLGGTLGYRLYESRRAQLGDGSYKGSRVFSMNRGANLVIQYALWKQLSLSFQANVLTYWSNTHYEATYPYNYTVATYLGGIRWAY